MYKEFINTAIVIDSERGKKVAELLYNPSNTTGIHGGTDMPEDIVPNSVVKREFILYLNFINYH